MVKAVRFGGGFGAHVQIPRKGWLKRGEAPTLRKGSLKTKFSRALRRVTLKLKGAWEAQNPRKAWLKMFVSGEAHTLRKGSLKAKFSRALRRVALIIDIRLWDQPESKFRFRARSKVPWDRSGVGILTRRSSPLLNIFTQNCTSGLKIWASRQNRPKSLLFAATCPHGRVRLKLGQQCNFGTWGKSLKGHLATQTSFLLHFSISCKKKNAIFQQKKMRV